MSYGGLEISVIRLIEERLVQGQGRRVACAHGTGSDTRFLSSHALEPLRSEGRSWQAPVTRCSRAQLPSLRPGTLLHLLHTTAVRPAPAGAGESRRRGALAIASAPRGACSLPVHGLTSAACSHRPLLRHRHGRPRNSSGPGGSLFVSSTSSLYGHISQLPLNDCISDMKHEQGAQPLKVSSCTPPVAAAFRSIPCRLPCYREICARRCGYGRRSGRRPRS